MKTSYKVLLFDLGGVLLRLRNPAETFGLQISEADFLQQWIQSPAVRQFECGAIDAETFAKRVVLEVDLSYSPQEFLDRFATWPAELYPDSVELLGSIAVQYSKALLSNTNELHWEKCDLATHLDGCFEHTFLSYQTGKLKPDADAFAHVQESYLCTAKEIAFFDDNPTNVDAARRFGCAAFLTPGVDALRTALSEIGVLA